MEDNELVLKPKPSSPKMLWIFRTFSMFTLLFCLVVLATEATVIKNP
jgi:hypothetical protein